MNHKAKQYQMEHKQRAKEQLAARIALLEGRGMKPEQWTKEAYVRKLKADIRRADARLRNIAASEKLNAHKVQVKQEKAEAEKQARTSAEVKPAKTKEAKPPKKEKKAKEKTPAAEAQD